MDLASTNFDVPNAEAVKILQAIYKKIEVTLALDVVPDLEEIEVAKKLTQNAKKVTKMAQMEGQAAVAGTFSEFEISAASDLLSTMNSAIELDDALEKKKSKTEQANLAKKLVDSMRPDAPEKDSANAYMAMLDKHQTQHGLARKLLDKYTDQQHTKNVEQVDSASAAIEVSDVSKWKEKKAVPEKDKDNDEEVWKIYKKNSDGSRLTSDRAQGQLEKLFTESTKAIGQTVGFVKSWKMMRAEDEVQKQFFFNEKIQAAEKLTEQAKAVCVESATMKVLIKRYPNPLVKKADLKVLEEQMETLNVNLEDIDFHVGAWMQADRKKCGMPEIPKDMCRKTPPAHAALLALADGEGANVEAAKEVAAEE
jgi:hypothetical protein